MALFVINEVEPVKGSEELVLFSGIDDWGRPFFRELWVRVKARKRSRCARTQEPIEPGDVVWRPLRNNNHRYLRVLAWEA